jgi:membrane-associated protease RseP (regulator of RpoE activity)
MADFSALAAAILLGPSAWAQTSALSQIEQQLPAPRAAAPVADANPTGYLGAELDDEGEMGKGVRVKSVRPGAPAQLSGLRDNDLITAIDSKKITSLDDYDANATRPPGAKLTMTVERAGRPQQVQVTLGTRPATPAVTDSSEAPPPPPPGTTTPSTTSPSLIPPTGPTTPSILPAPTPGETGRIPGIVAQPQEPRTPAIDLPGDSPSPAIASGGGASLGITVPPAGEPSRALSRGRRGAYVKEVKAGSPAEQAGLRAGNIIVLMDTKRIESDDDLVTAIRAARPGQEVELRWYDGDRLMSKFVRLGTAGSTVAAPPPAPAPAPGSGPGLGGILGGSILPGRGEGTAGGPGSGGNRPLLRGVERAVDSFSRSAQGGSIVPSPSQYDPHVMASLQKSVADLAAAVSSLEDRLKAVEVQLGRTTPSAPGLGGTTNP